MLIFSISRRVTGHALTPAQRGILDDQARRGGHSCDYCGYSSPHNRAVFRDTNPLNTAQDNLGVADPICEAWQKLDSVSAEAGVMVYLPALAPEDANHLQRAIVQALSSTDDEYRSDAQALLDWLTTHDSPVKQAWGTTHPQAFAQTLSRLDEEGRQTAAERWQHLALVLHPARIKGQLATDGLEAGTTWWRAFYHDYLSRS
ncbi:TPA: hypothetical protein SMF45_004363 [Serratia marcescens]|uniref:hypothetical protein n=1 Tax=Serratia marcescens TaxID=615 RepID=UPI0018D74A77|nr:hypothetical protein [Serratia marcescens]HEJ7047466.1 hypothetical protein [Serratia marcescens]HEJ9022537.1 hypothetical protein [Serratia marcescens]HEJ9028267.1 hypothetical protein [Serratia marcescens]HEJ9043993.1 hypothetical protein [Serratia marcescens]